MTIVSFGSVDEDDCIDGADENLFMGDNDATNEYEFAVDCDTFVIDEFAFK